VVPQARLLLGDSKMRYLGRHNGVIVEPPSTSSTRSSLVNDRSHSARSRSTTANEAPSTLDDVPKVQDTATVALLPAVRGSYYRQHTMDPSTSSFQSSFSIPYASVRLWRPAPDQLFTTRSQRLVKQKTAKYLRFPTTYDRPAWLYLHTSSIPPTWYASTGPHRRYLHDPTVLPAVAVLPALRPTHAPSVPWTPARLCCALPGVRVSRASAVHVRRAAVAVSWDCAWFEHVIAFAG
jgi:hypothetical protein